MSQKREVIEIAWLCGCCFLAVKMSSRTPRSTKLIGTPWTSGDMENHDTFIKNGDAGGPGASLLPAVTTSQRFITQEFWLISAEDLCSFQAAILNSFHRFFRGRDSIKGNGESPLIICGDGLHPTRLPYTPLAAIIYLSR